MSIASRTIVIQAARPSEVRGFRIREVGTDSTTDDSNGVETLRPMAIVLINAQLKHRCKPDAYLASKFHASYFTAYHPGERRSTDTEGKYFHQTKHPSPPTIVGQPLVMLRIDDSPDNRPCLLLGEHQATDQDPTTHHRYKSNQHQFATPQSMQNEQCGEVGGSSDHGLPNGEIECLNWCGTAVFGQSQGHRLKFAVQHHLHHLEEARASGEHKVAQRLCDNYPMAKEFSSDPPP